MSHELEIINGEAQAMYRDVAWHRLGQVVGDNFSWADAVAKDLAITYPVTTVPMSELVLGYKAQDDEFGTVRSDGLVLKCGLGTQHTVFHAEEGYAFGEVIRQGASSYGTEANLRSLGTLRKGRQWFLTFDLGKFYIGDYDVRDYLSVNGSYDSSWALTVLSAPIIEVCDNTVAAATAMGTKHYVYKHTSGIFDRVEEAKRALARHEANRMAFIAAGERLQGQKVDEATYKGIMDKLFPITDDVPVKTRNVNSGARDTVRALYTADSTLIDVTSGVEGTAWGVMQAVNTYENWGAPIRKTAGLGEASTRALRQIDATVAGKQPLTAKALELLAV